jgi:cytochrome-b5 reductase
VTLVKDQGFISLALDSVENINHNTKKFRFKFDDPESVSGLNVASALLTKYKGPEMEKPAIRPYTPTSDEGKILRIDRFWTEDTRLTNPR